MTTVWINGREITVEPQYEKSTLLLYLRDILRLTGTKCGCATGDCGACKVLVDGEAMNSCLLKMAALDGKQITTIEGIGREDRLDPIQEAFVNAGAIQCGYCTPGMIITTKALLTKNPDPSEVEIRKALDNNLCRCTGYVKIVQAIQEAARLIRLEERKKHV